MPVQGLFEDFLRLVEAEDREGCVRWALARLESGELDIVGLYEGILAPALNTMVCRDADARVCIWREHVRSSIVRTVIESCYPFVLKERDARETGREGGRGSGGTEGRGRRAVVLCPAEEYHEIGARMVADFLTLCGFDVTFVGANTPFDDFIAGIELFRPEIVAVSVTNPYSLLATRKAITAVREALRGNVMVIVGGSAFRANPALFRETGADLLLQTYGEIDRFARGAV
ncbi:MAG: cobalamin B12-binding domain-containing protein [Thermoplasmatota archaeon]